MELHDALLHRRSIRRFAPDPIAPEVIERLVEAAHWAPFGTREDDRLFLALGGEKKAEFVAFLEQRIAELEPALREASPRQLLVLGRSVLPVVREAPVILLVYTLLAEEGPLLALGSVGAAVENLLLAAHAEGLGACWLTGATYLADDIEQFLGLEGMQLVGLVPVGYPSAPPPQPKPRQSRLYWRGFADRSEAPLPRPSRTLDLAESAEGRGATVLLVDDTPPARDFMAHVLRGAGYQVAHCTTGAEALALADERAPDLIVADALLAGMTGYQLAMRLREKQDGLLPILLTTTSYTSQDETYALQAGADAMLDKPLRPHRLLAHAASLLRVKRLYDQVQQDKLDLERRQEEQRSLTHLIVHDLRTPLTSILGALRVVIDNDYQADLLHEMLPMAIHASDTMMGLINDLLDVAKMESSIPDLDLQPVSVGEIMAQVRELTLGAATERGLELDMTPPHPPLEVEADAGFLRRALTNLVGNALKFTYEGGVRVWAEPAAEGFIALRVQDTGPGIPPEALDRIFEKFGQVEQPPGAPRVGTGLGLTFVKLATESMGGHVEVESELDHGSTFSVYLPRA